MENQQKTDCASGSQMAALAARQMAQWSEMYRVLSLELQAAALSEWRNQEAVIHRAASAALAGIAAQLREHLQAVETLERARTPESGLASAAQLQETLSGRRFGQSALHASPYRGG